MTPIRALPEAAEATLPIPRELANLLARAGDIDGRSVLVPSAGDGILAAACLAHGARWVHCIESDPLRTRQLEVKGFIYTEADFLTLAVGQTVDRVVVGLSAAKTQEVNQIKRALRWLKPGGIFVSLVNSHRTRCCLKALLSGKDHTIEAVPTGPLPPSRAWTDPMMLKIRSDSRRRQTGPDAS